MNKLGIITFHNSYNCGSMLESYAIYTRMCEINKNTEIIDFSNKGQYELYSVFHKPNTIKNIIKNMLLLPHKKHLDNNNKMYEKFKKDNFKLSKNYHNNSNIIDDYSVVIAGSDQIWNTTIADFDDVYFLNWVTKAKKVAYAPSFGSKNILKCSDNPSKYKEYLNSFASISIRENNGKKWIKDLTGKNVPVIIDPTLLYDSNEYDKLLDNNCTPSGEYIFFYCPSFDRSLCSFVKKVAKKYNLPVICWSAKSYYKKMIFTYGFKLPKYESPSVYLSLIKNAKLVFTTSFHGTIFSTIYRKKFYTLKNGDMYGDDDRVMTLLEQIKMTNRLIEPNFAKEFDYLKEVDYDSYEKSLIDLRKKANKYIEESVGAYYEKAK